jgi:CheY-like chemotaxis protein
MICTSIRQSSSPAQEPASPARRVLVVEDEWIIAQDLTSLLLRIGHIPIGHAANAADAIRLAVTEKPDLILMDIQLDGAMDGTAAAAEIARRYMVPIVYITANSHDFLSGDHEMMAPYICIAKPFSEQSIAAAIETIVF